MHSVTRYLVAITELLFIQLERGLEFRLKGTNETGNRMDEVKERLGKIKRIEKVDDIDFEWVSRADIVWKSSQWARVLHTMVQESVSTLISGEIEGLSVFFFFFFF